jgi:hypothetical protein
MKKLFVSFLLLFVSLVSFSQTYDFEVKSYDLYVVDDFPEKDSILKNSNISVPMVCDRKYTIDLDSMILKFYENGEFVENFKITNLVDFDNETLIFVESYTTKTDYVTTIYIYFKLHNNKINDVCFLWPDFVNNRTFLKDIK